MDGDSNQPHTDAPALPSEEPPQSTSWTEGNLAIVSSDNFLFKVPDYYIRAASVVFCNWMDEVGGGYLVLVDDTNETSETVSLFLDLVVNGHLGTRDLAELVALAHFLQRYECPKATKMLCAEVYRQESTGEVRSFIVGAVLGDDKFCADVLWGYPLPMWGRAATDTAVNTGAPVNPSTAAAVDPVETRTSTGCHFDTHTWPLSWVETLPTKYRWALDRAWHVAGHGGQLAGEFRKRLQETKGK
ncbi:hypothetical protein Q8F55_002746 [Vanrija albida]|uniref:BTB domain-containing protein n=1 Tax=Vanrija albida TaxID=181172 RepID=A0ABR3QAM5_9TREE